MYASVLIGGFLSGDSLPIAMDRATRFTELAIQTTFSYGTVPGAAYSWSVSWAGLHSRLYSKDIRSSENNCLKVW